MQIAITTESQIDRFKSKISPEPISGCWLWTAATNQRGYGVFNRAWDNDRKRSMTMLAHRFSYWIAYGEIEDKMQVLHHCDNPACVNPNHLFLGSPAANVADMDAKGRRVNKPLFGSSHPNSKVSDEDVMLIFHLRKQGMTQQQIGERFGISQVQVGNILRKDQWKHIQ